MGSKATYQPTMSIFFKVTTALSRLMGTVDKHEIHDTTTSYPTIPFDVICSIIEHADLETLRKISLLNRDCNYVASKYLWRHVSILISFSPRSGQTSDLEVFNLILRSPRRALRIRKLTITVAGYSNDAEGARWHKAELDSILGYIIQALSVTTQLTALHLNTYYFGAEIAHVLGTVAFPFQLDTLESPLENIHDLVPFLSKQPSIRRWFLSRSYSPTQLPNLPPNILPKLEVVATTPPHLATLTSGRPVHTLDLVNVQLRPSYAPFLDAGISASTSPILRLRTSLEYVNKDDNNDREDDITRLAIICPFARRLRTLEVVCVVPFPSTLPPVSRETAGAGELVADIDETSSRFPASGPALERFAGVLGSFPELEELIWRSPVAGAATRMKRLAGRSYFVSACTRGCSTLRRIVIDGDLMDLGVSKGVHL